MTVLMRWTACAVLLLGFAGGVRAEETVSPDLDLQEPVTNQVAALLGQENAALKRLDATAVAKALKEPAKSSGGEATDVTYDAEWLAQLPMPKKTAELDCLAQAVYFEARGEPIRGQAAVAEVVLNRVDSPMFPRTVCGVVNQQNAGGCQFSYVCDGKPETIGDRKAWDRSARIAGALLSGAPRNLTEGATHFHTPAVTPSWSKRFLRTATIGSHLFYRPLVLASLN